MHIKKLFCSKLGVLGLILVISHELINAQEVESLAIRIVSWTEADQVAWIKDYLGQGMPTSEVIGTLVSSRSSSTLPLLEKQVEEIIQSDAPKNLFTNPYVDPERVVFLATSLIAAAADEQALREASKLIAIDSKRFGSLVGRTLDHAMNRGNPFAVAYQGLALGDPAVGKQILAWIEKVFADQRESIQTIFRRSLAEAMVERYHGEPTLIQMANDPISLRLQPAEYAAMEPDLRRYAFQANRKRTSAH